MKNLFKKIPISHKEVLTSLLLLFGFLTVNIEILPMGEYQPIALMALAVAAFFQDGKLSFRLIWVSATLILMAIVGMVFSSFFDFASALKIVVLAVYIIFGWRLVPFCNFWVIRAVVLLCLGVIVAGILSSSVTSSILGIFFPRGVIYYYGFNSFFASEPSYASLNLFGLYVMYLLNNVVNKKKNPDETVYLLISVILVATFSVTGIISALIIVLYKIFSTGRWSIKSKLVIYCLLVLAIFMGLIFAEQLATSRVASVFYFLGAAFGGDFLANWLLLEPSSVVRFIANAAGWFEGIGSLFGTGTFALIGPSSPYLPGWLSTAFSSTTVIGEGSSAQTPFFNLILYSGYIALFLYALILVFIFRPIMNLPKGVRFITIVFLIICSFWQAAITYPFYWIVISYLIHERFLTDRKISRIFEIKKSHGHLQNDVD